MIYKSVRHKEGYCIAALRPPAVSIPKPTLRAISGMARPLRKCWMQDRLCGWKNELILLNIFQSFIIRKQSVLYPACG